MSDFISRALTICLLVRHFVLENLRWLLCRIIYESMIWGLLIYNIFRCLSNYFITFTRPLIWDVDNRFILRIWLFCAAGKKRVDYT